MMIMGQAEVITTKVPKELKAQMKQIDINWSEYIRQCIQKRIDEEKMRAAFRRLDEIKKKTNPTSTEEIVAWIREDRER
jgi:5'-deoxynucleotidase YfbR-like HD superfamily hydrolase